MKWSRSIRTLVPANWIFGSLIFFCMGSITSPVVAAAMDVSYSIASTKVNVYDYIEVTAKIVSPGADNPFEDAVLTGSFDATDGSGHWNVNGFCDSMDGSLFRIRFMPPRAGDYKYSVVYRQGKFQKSTTGTFHAIDADLPGILRDDPKYPWHFIWEGTGQHYFFNGTTAYWLVGWRDEHLIQYSLDRLHRLKVNRLRVTIAGRCALGMYGEPVMIDKNWTCLIAQGRRILIAICGEVVTK